ncbi:solute carrier family 25 member 35-like [Saccoglossus kowalevskii]|uniref:Solute carrier family 25 member 35-like n=1 Tax=Saccoglossus kowalevskii TaxID=10224 RepID=A0ABM0GV53_SACKO|nr:PREDICTED: solute carrier family 25 member 35-like [Saccoglossus kowalevskii]
MTEFILGGLAACGACLFSNPLEVVKIRMQLQGELQARGTYVRSYKNAFHGFYTVGKVDGLLALQKGLVPALFYQLLMNGTRLGTFQCLKNAGLITDKNGDVVFWQSVVAGAFSGSCGAIVGSPMYLVKTHLQSQSNVEIAVGHQHTHNGMTSALRTIYKEHGVIGLWRGVSGAVPRVMVGSGAQLSTFSTIKDMVEKSKIFKHESWFIPITSSCVSAVVVTAFMTPFDVVSTRLYNQGTDARGKGIFYTGFFDCFLKILRKEGPLGFYKGWTASFFRLGPHSILSLVFWDKLRHFYTKIHLQN